MLPIVLNRTAGQVGLAGCGEAFENRRRWLEAAGVQPTVIDPEDRLDGLKLLFVAGLPVAEAEPLARRSKASGVLVNVEDEPSLCDFYVPALVRRGDLVISVSTGGRSPAVAKLLRQWLDARFGPEWASYLDQASDARHIWRAEGADGAELSKRTRELATAGGWLE